MSEAYDSVMEGLEQALAFAEGRDVGAQVNHVAVPSVNVAAIRAETDLPQSVSARRNGITDRGKA